MQWWNRLFTKTMTWLFQVCCMMGVVWNQSFFFQIQSPRNKKQPGSKLTTITVSRINNLPNLFLTILPYISKLLFPSSSCDVYMSKGPGIEKRTSTACGMPVFSFKRTTMRQALQRVPTKRKTPKLTPQTHQTDWKQKNGIVLIFRCHFPNNTERIDTRVKLKLLLHWISAISNVFYLFWRMLFPEK